MLLKIKEKKCKRCNSDEWYIVQSKEKTVFNCKKCILQYNKKNVKKKRETDPEFIKKWKKYAKEYYYNNTEKVKNTIKKAQKNSRENLTDTYIKGYLYRDIYINQGITIKADEFPQDIINKTREILLIKRKMKNENKKEIKAN